MTLFGHSRRAQIALGAGAASLILGWLIPLRPQIGGTAFALAALGGLAFVAAGLVATARRPDDPMGTLMVAIGVLYPIAQGASEGEVPWRYTLYLALDDAWIPLLAYVALSFPAARLTRTWDRLLLGGLALLIYGWIPFELAWTAPSAECLACPPAGNLLFAQQPPLDLLEARDRYADVRSALIGLALVSMAARWVRATRPLRSVIGPVLLTTAALAAKTLADEVWLVDAYVVFEPEARDLVTVPNGLLVMAIPLSFVAGLVRARVARGGLTDLMIDIARTTDAATLRDLLARALGDPALRVGFWAQPVNGYVDATGVPLTLPGPDDHEVCSPVEGAAGPLAVLVHDPALLEDRGYVAAVGAAARLALENERLKAEVRAQLEQVSRSRARIVEASDAERRRIERDLHDGAQQRLVSLALTLRLLRSSHPEDRDALFQSAEEHAATALEELRDLARGIHPTLLTEAGLAAALGGLAESAPVAVRFGELPPARLPDRVEAAAYFVCSEAIANAGKHAQATEVVISASTVDGALVLTIADDGVGGARFDGGTGLRGLSDRVEALGGHLSVDSPPGEGTRLSAAFPLSGS